jgi:DNA-binding LacI/PurR family transcriptional regulator
MHAAGLKANRFYLPPVPTTWEEIAADRRVESARELLQAHHPTAIVAYSMYAALPLLHAARQLGWRVPQDLSLVVFREDPDTENGIALTTVCVSMWTVGTVAAEMLVEKINNLTKSLATRATEPTLFTGTTCAAPRQK